MPSNNESWGESSLWELSNAGGHFFQAKHTYSLFCMKGFAIPGYSKSAGRSIESYCVGTDVIVQHASDLQKKKHCINMSAGQGCTPSIAL